MDIPVEDLDSVGGLALLGHYEEVSLVGDGSLEATVGRIVVEEVHLE